MFKKIWHDPVWSKVIASIIIAMGVVGIKFWDSVSVFITNTSIQKNEINILPSQVMPLPTVPKVANSKPSPLKDKTLAVDVTQSELKTKSSVVIKSNSDILSHQALPKETLSSNEEDTKSTINLSVSTKNKEAVALAITALKGEVGSNRQQSIAALIGTLPNNLNTMEIALFLEDSTGSTRNEILKILMTKTTLKSLNPENISDILGQEVGSNRFNCAKTITPYIKLPINGMQAASILGDEVGSNRVNVLKIIAPLIKHPISESEVKAILEGVLGSSKTEAISVLFNKAAIE